jgi:hypothetical protein
VTPSIADWANFFVAEVGAAAALTGLIVVAVSINLSRILSFPQLPPRAAESIVMLTGALIISSFGLVPRQPIALFGAEVLAVGLLVLAVALRNQLQLTQPVQGVTQFKIFMRALVNASVALPLVIGGILLWLGWSAGLYLAGIGILIALAAGVWSAWILLIEIMR